ncbi:MAG TPA: DUF402 domain-containing protein [Lachnospiraceae bacterium]|nr:DUF402 domain-containing protein [Lachnospiraceae bacterium]
MENTNNLPDTDIKLFRKRLIPMECVALTDDEILFADEKTIVTKWNTLKPKKELHHGLSCYYLNEGFKVSRFMNREGALLYWYCDIVSPDYNSNTNTWVFTDLLADVVIFPDDSVRVIDLDEVGTALTDGLISTEQCVTLLNSLDRLLNIIYEGGFSELKDNLERFL